MSCLLQSAFFGYRYPPQSNEQIGKVETVGENGKEMKISVDFQSVSSNLVGCCLQNLTKGLYDYFCVFIPPR